MKRLITHKILKVEFLFYIKISALSIFYTSCNSNSAYIIENAENSRSIYQKIESFTPELFQMANNHVLSEMKKN